MDGLGRKQSGPQGHNTVPSGWDVPSRFGLLPELSDGLLHGIPGVAAVEEAILNTGPKRIGIGLPMPGPTYKIASAIL